MSSRISSLCMSLVASALLAQHAAAGDPWTDLGSPLDGTTGAPVLAGTGSLYAGAPVAIELTNARRSSLAGLFIGLSPVAIPFKGGTLQVNPIIPPIVIPTSSAGEIPIAFDWPEVPAGVDVSFQYVIVDPGGPAGFALSNGLLASNEVTVPTVTGSSTTTIGEGGSIDVFGSGFDEDPIDYCAQVVDVNGETIAFLKGVAANGTSLTLNVDAVLPGASTGQLMIVPGHGYTPTMSPPQSMVLNGSPWIWDGDLGKVVTLPGPVTVVPPPPATTCTKTKAVLEPVFKDQISFVFADLDGLCPKNTEFTFDLHFNDCAAGVHFDANIPLENTVPLTTNSCTSKIMNFVKDVFENQYGPDFGDQFDFGSTKDTVNNTWTLTITNLQSTFCSVSGYFRICGETDCDVTTVTPTPSAVNFDFPCTPGTDVTVDITAFLSGGLSCNVSASISIPDPAPAAGVCAELMTSAIEAEFATCGIDVTGVYLSGTQEIALLPPLFPAASWLSTTAVQITTCP